MGFFHSFRGEEIFGYFAAKFWGNRVVTSPKPWE